MSAIEGSSNRQFQSGGLFFVSFWDSLDSMATSYHHFYSSIFVLTRHASSQLTSKCYTIVPVNKNHIESLSIYEGRWLLNVDPSKFAHYRRRQFQIQLAPGGKGIKIRSSFSTPYILLASVLNSKVCCLKNFTHSGTSLQKMWHI